MRSTDSLDSIRRLVSQERFSEAASQCLARLREEPGDIEANLLYGKLAIHMRRPQEAIIIFRKLLSFAPDHADAHDHLAYVYSYLADHFNARRHAEAALRLSPQLLESRLALGSAYLVDGEGAAALDMFASARKLAPGNIAIERSYVDALLQCGEFEQAQTLLRKLIDRHPRNMFLYALLARSQKFTAKSADARLVYSLINDRDELLNPPDDADAEIAANMSLHKVCSDLGENARAFTFLTRAKDIRKTQTSYDHGQNVAMVEQLETFFDEAFFAMHQDANLGYPSQAPIFITCMPRSGSTLLERVLSSHPDVVAAGELPLAAGLLQEVCARFGKNQDDLSALQRLPADVWSQIGQEYLKRARNRIPDSPFFIDKMPSNFLLIGFIRAALPQAKIIHLQRHPVANCLSIFETNFSGGHPYANDQVWLGQFYTLYRRSMQHWQRVIGDDIIQVSYEELVNDTAGTLERLGQQLSLEFDPSRISSSQQSGHILTASLWQARQPIHTGSVARWQHLEAQLAPLLEALSPVWPEPEGDR